MKTTRRETKKHLKDIFNHATRAAVPEEAIRACLTPSTKGRFRVNKSAYDLLDYDNVYVIGAGKAATQMATGAEEALGEWITGGLVVTKYGHAPKKALKRIHIVEASHPIPDTRGMRCAAKIFHIAERATKRDLVLCLLSGGTSSLLPAPMDGITLADKKRITRLLLFCGASIAEINTVRKHLSYIKGGELAVKLYPATVLTLIVSDVIGDDISTIASGPTAPDVTTYDDALSIIVKYELEGVAPPSVIKALRKGKLGLAEETPKPGDKIFRKVENHLVSKNLTALDAAAKRARALGFKPIILSSSIDGETREAARLFCSVLKEISESGHPVARPACVIMGGETTLKVTGRGKGGRNQEFALHVATMLENSSGIHILSADTDGSDGPTDAAGAFADPTTTKRGEKKGVEARRSLEENDSYHYFEEIGDLLKTGPTGTNVMDIVIGLVS